MQGESTRMNDNIDYRTDQRPDHADFAMLWRAAWGADFRGDLDRILEHSLGFICAYEGGALVGYVNIAWDGGVHAFLLDPCVDPSRRSRGIGSDLVRHAIDLARQRGAEWLHVDFEPQLEAFYQAAGFRETKAGLIKL